MIIETISAIAILGIAILFLNPGHLTMPDTMMSMLIIALIVSFLTFAAYLFREKSSDEREAVHNIYVLNYYDEYIKIGGELKI